MHSGQTRKKEHFLIRSLPAILIFVCIAAQAPAYAKDALQKEELDFEFTPDLMQTADTPPRQAQPDGIKAGILAVKEEVAAKKAVAEPAPLPPREDASTAALARARSFYDAGRYEDAIAGWEEALERDPGNTGIKEKIREAEMKIEARAAARQPVSPVVVMKAPAPPPAPAAARVSRAEPATEGQPFLNRFFNKEVGVEKIKTAGRQKSVVGAPREGLYTLEECIDIAIKNSIPLQVARKSLTLAEMRVMEARRNMLPSATITYDQYNGEVYGRNYVGRKQYIEGQQPLFHGGELFYTMRQAEVNREITRNETAKIRNELVLQVKKGYYTLVKSKDNLEIQKTLSAAADRILDMVRRQDEANITSKIEVLNVESQASQIGYQLASADGDVSVAELILKQTMNVDPNLRVDVASDLSFTKIPVNYEQVLAAALVNRAEIRINTLMVDYYRYSKRIAGAKSTLKVDLLGSWGLAKEEYAFPDNLGPTGQFDPVTGSPIYDIDQKLSQQWYAGVKASYPFWGSTAEYSFTREQWVPVVSAYQGTEAATHSMKLKLFDQLGLFSEAQLADIDYDRSRQELIKIRQDVTLEVKEQCFSYDKALIQLDTASKKVRFQEKDLELTKMKRGLDEAADSNVVDGMIKLAQEKFGYVQALTDCHVAIAGINKAIGIEDYFKDEAR